MSSVHPPLSHRPVLSRGVSALLAVPLFLLAGCGDDALQEPLLRQQSADLLSLSVTNPTAALVGRWDPQLIDGEVPAVSMALMHDGRVLYWSGVDAAEEHEPGTLEYYLEAQLVTGHIHEASTRVLNLSGSGPLIATPPNPLGAREGDLFCAGHSILPDGRVLTVGGTQWENLPVPDIGDELAQDGGHESEGLALLHGLNHAQYFDPAVGAWVATQDMQFGRWYPSILTLPDGNAMVATGMKTAGTSTLQTAIERFDVSTEQWTTIGQRSLPMYARLTLVPSGPLAGRVFYSTSGQLWGPSGADPLEATWNLQQVCDWRTGSCEYLGPSLAGVRQHGTSVLLPLDPADGYRARILTFGGTLQRSALATALAEVADLGTTLLPLNKPAAPLHFPRWMANGVLLPDGKVLATGGALVDTTLTFNQPGDYVMNAELYDPRTGQWAVLAPMQLPRAYHSSALLLPDGRVLLGGHVPLPFPSRLVRDEIPNMEQVVETRFEIFEPPYLFRGERPVIRSAPRQVRVGEVFDVETSYAQELESVVLIRPSATTHGYDADQRMVRLVHTRMDGARIRVTAPPNTHVTPPGYYMLFVNRRTALGPVPSEARFIRVLGN